MGRKSILVVEDQAAYQVIIRGCLSAEFDLDYATTMGDALEKLKARRFDLILLDIVLPDGDGFDVCRQLRRESKNDETPIIVVTSRDQISDKMLGFENGADDYVTKPFNVSELRARVHANILRPHRAPSGLPDSLSFASLYVDVRARRVTVGDAGTAHEIKLTNREYELLVFLLSHPDQAFSRAQLLDRVWGSESDVVDRTVDTHISRLRKKINCLEVALESVPGAGYRFSPRAVRREAA